MPLLVDLYCGEGGSAEGYAQAGWDVIGVDINPQPRFPYTFIKANCLDPDHRLFRLADAISASPPCQGMTEMNNDKSRHLNLIPATRALLQASGKPYVIENVRGARPHLINPVSLFGTMFDNHCIASDGTRFVLSRERLFETNWGLPRPIDYGTSGAPIANIIGGHFRVRSGKYRTGKGTGRTVDLPGEDRPALARQLMGMPAGSMAGMSEAVPPAYCRYIGERLREYLRI